MRRALLTAFACLLLYIAALAQSYEGHTDYNKKKQKAMIIECSHPQEAVENAIVQKIRGMGNRASEEKGMFNKDKGCIVFRNASVSEISERNLDYIIKVERKSRKEDDISMLYLIVSKNGENILSSDERCADRAKEFLNELVPDIEDANLEIDIRSQEEEVVKSQKKFKDLQTDKENMEKKIKQLQEDLEKNAKDQEAQQKEIENKKQLLDGLKGKKRPKL
jgi:hypothetical protein